MVGNHRGFHEWVVQRISAVLIGIYTVFVVFFLICHAPLHYISWQMLFAHPAMKIATLFVLIAILWHAWIGLWTVFTDYVKNRAIRLLLEIGVIFLLISYLVWCLKILS